MAPRETLAEQAARAEQAERDGMAYEAALDALASPREILARALQRAVEADEAYEQVRTGNMVPSAAAAALGRIGAARDVAQTLDGIARTAVMLADVEQQTRIEVADGGDFYADGPEPEPMRDDGPHALACRFTAQFEGEEVGTIGGQPTVFVPGHGWIGTEYADSWPPVEGSHARRLVTFRGRAVSRYNDQVLVITDGGVGMTLPAALVKLEPDE